MSIFMTCYRAALRHLAASGAVVLLTLGLQSVARAEPPAPSAKFSFTKIIVEDLEKPAAFYKAVFGMREVARVRDGLDANTPIEEIILSLSGDMASEPPLILFKFLGRKPPKDSDSILGFTVMDLNAVVARVKQSGGKIVQPPRDDTAHGVRVAFATDTDGRLMEIVQMLPTPAKH